MEYVRFFRVMGLRSVSALSLLPSVWTRMGIAIWILVRLGHLALQSPAGDLFAADAAAINAEQGQQQSSAVDGIRSSAVHENGG